MATPGTQLEKRASVGTTGQMAAGANALWTRARVAWAGMAPRQRIWAIAAAFMLAALVSGSAWYGLRTDWRTLCSGLDPEDARQVGLVLTQAQIPFDVADSGMTLRVPAAQLDKARLATAAKGAVKSGRMGFELFDKPNWVGSEFDEQVNYQRALEGELEHTIGSLSDVESARVHLVLAHDSLFRDQERPAKASVVLKLRHGSLAEDEPDSIRNLVASAVDGLASERVVLVDASGHLSLGPRTAEGMRLTAEQLLEEKLISTLEPVTGAGNVRASVTLEYAPEAIDETRESYDPTQSATLSMERSEETAGGQPVATGVPGTASNAPNAQSVPVYPKQASPVQGSKTESSTYGVSKTTRHTVESAGKLRRLTAAIVVNHRLAQPPTKNKPAQWLPRSADELRNLTSLAQAAVGFDAARNDVLTVQDLGFEENQVQPEASFAQQFLSKVQGSPELLKYTSLLLGMGIILAFGVRPAVRGALAASNTSPDSGVASLPGQTHSALPAPESNVNEPERRRAQEVFENVRNQMKKEPAQSSRLLQSWLHSDGN